jgi:hypothetical protein
VSTAGPAVVVVDAEMVGSAAAAQVYAGLGARRIAAHEREHGLYVQSEGEKQNDAS